MRLGPVSQRYFFAHTMDGQAAIWDRGEQPDGRVRQITADRARWLCSYHRSEGIGLQEAAAVIAEYHRARFSELHDALAAYWRDRLPAERRAAA